MLRLAGSGTCSRKIAVMLRIARSTVQDNLKRAAMAGLRLPLASDLTDDVLKAKLFVHPGASGASDCANGPTKDRFRLSPRSQA
jgi:transposase